MVVHFKVEELSFDLSISWDQTGICYVPVELWTMKKEGSKWVELVGLDKKITVVLGGPLIGELRL